jgi:hypothetical protein
MSTASLIQAVLSIVYIKIKKHKHGLSQKRKKHDVDIRKYGWGMVDGHCKKMLHQMRYASASSRFYDCKDHDCKDWFWELAEDKLYFV